MAWTSRPRRRCRWLPGPTALAGALRLVGRDGTVMLFGNSSGEESAVSFASFVGQAHARLYAFFIYESREYESREPPTFGEDLGLLLGDIAAGQLRPQIGAQSSRRNPSARRNGNVAASRVRRGGTTAADAVEHDALGGQHLSGFS